MLTSNEIRRMFVEFFKERDHAYVAGASLVPPPDSTLLFTNAGMNQFVDILKGNVEPKYTRAVNYQRCMRVSGKHNDLMEVGVDHTHHTLFEMLGNWSFGDYGKKESIVWAWEFLTEKCKLPKSKLWVSVFRDDDEAEQLWKDNTDVNPKRILRFDEKENFWEMGETGPCGPCSEIHIDLNSDDPNGPIDTENSLEIWNLVFIQFQRMQDGSLVPLKNLSVDTGMGMERLVSLLQGSRSNYDTDIFEPLMKAIESLSGIKYKDADEQKRIAFRVICDHVRALTFLISDGIMPANDGRGYVLRKVLRRSVLHGRNLGFDKPFVAKLVPHIIEKMKDAYPELSGNEKVVEKVVTNEEERFQSVLHSGLRALDEEMESLGKHEKVLPGDVAFRMADTYGVPIDFIEEDIAPARGMTVDRQGYEKLMQEQRKRARQAKKSKGDEAALEELLRDQPATQFSGYTTLHDDAIIQLCIAGNQKVDALEEGQEGMIILDCSPFYAESGGQIGDRGSLTASGGTFAVSDTQKTAGGHYLHIGKVTKGKIEKGAKVQAKVHDQRRWNAAHHHTATHLMNHALREVLGNHVKQSGSLVTPDYLRFDFTHYESVTPEQLNEIEQRVNAAIRGDFPVGTQEMNMDEAQAEGALAFFGDKYGDDVRVVSIGDFSKELCGGTHVRTTGEIGAFFIQKEGAISTGVRRIEAVAGEAAYRRARKAFDLLKEVQSTIHVSEDELQQGLNRVIEERKQLAAQNEKLMRELGKAKVTSAIEHAESVNGIKVVAIDIGEVEGNTAPVLRDLGDQIANHNETRTVAVVAAQVNGRVNFVVRLGKEAVNCGLDANKIIKEVAKKAGGSGGGRKDMAQGGAPNASGLKTSLEAAPQIVEQLLGNE